MTLTATQWNALYRTWLLHADADDDTYYTILNFLQCQMIANTHCTPAPKGVK